MIPEERKELIIKLLKEEEICKIDDLSNKLKISRVTTHRDLNKLEKEGIVVKVHGGVTLSKNKEIKTYFDERIKQNYIGKVEIAQKAIKLIEKGTNIFFDSSSSSYILAQEVYKNMSGDVTIITNSPVILNEAKKYPNSRVISTGGAYNHAFNTLEGEIALNTLRSLNFNSAFVSVAGLSIEKGLTTTSHMIANILKNVFNNTNDINVLADSTKFKKVGLITIEPLERVSRIITDSFLEADILKEYKEIIGPNFIL